MHCSTHHTGTLSRSLLRHTAAHCNTLQHTATHCNTLQHTATRITQVLSAKFIAAHCNALQRTATHGNTRQHNATHITQVPTAGVYCNALQRTATHCTHCNTHHTGTHSRSLLQHTVIHYNALQHTSHRYSKQESIATHCNTLQHTATHITQVPTAGVYWILSAVHCSALVHCSKISLQRTVTHCNALQRTATHCNALQHTATHCNTLQLKQVLVARVYWILSAADVVNIIRRYTKTLAQKSLKFYH